MIDFDLSDERELALALAYAEGDNLLTGGSRYGTRASDCAPYAVALAWVVADAEGEEISLDAIDYAMSLVVNSHDDVASLLWEHGRGQLPAAIDDEIDWSDLDPRDYVAMGRERGEWFAEDVAAMLTPAQAAEVFAELDRGADGPDYVAAPAWLSGEWAGESIGEIFGEPEPEDYQLSAYEDAATSAYWDTLIALLATFASIRTEEVTD